jgi:hypothetical protein
MMIRNAAIALLLLAPSALAAQTPETGQGRLEIVGEAAGACLIRGQPTATATNATYTAAGSSGGRLIINMAGAESLGVKADISLDVVCNTPHRLVVKSDNGGMRRNGATTRPQGPFVELLPYSFSAGWLGQNASAQSVGPGRLEMVSNEGGSGQLALGVVVPQGVRLVGGDYRDAVILEFRAAD